ncbi:MAG: hypothetical protein OXC91_05520 [Rhodobacteraceae bacterium]|nr:hypothetical protein [Paracoccaceae bacterium]
MNATVRAAAPHKPACLKETGRNRTLAAYRKDPMQSVSLTAANQEVSGLIKTIRQGGSVLIPRRGIRLTN